MLPATFLGKVVQKAGIDIEMLSGRMVMWLDVTSSFF